MSDARSVLPPRESTVWDDPPWRDMPRQRPLTAPRSHERAETVSEGHQAATEGQESEESA